MAPVHGLSIDEADRLLELSRTAAWSFPTSFGNPTRETVGEGTWLDGLAERRNAFPVASQMIIEARRIDDAVELAANIWRVWMVALRDEAGGRAFLAPVLDAGRRVSTRYRALALYGDGMLALRLGAVEESRERNEHALASAQATGDPEALTLAFLGLGRVSLFQGDLVRAAELATEALQFAYGPEQRRVALHLLAQAKRAGGELDEAARFFAGSLALNREVGDLGMVDVELQNLGHVEVHRGNADAAEALFAEAYTGSEDPYAMAMSSLNGAAVAFARGDRSLAGDLVAQARTVFEESGIEPAQDDQAELDWLAERLETPEPR